MAEVGTLDYARSLVCVFRAIGALLGGNPGEDTNPGPEDQRVEEEDSLRPVHHHRLPHRFVHSDPWRGLQRGEQVHGHHRQRLPGELHRTGEPLLGWRHAPAVYLRAGVMPYITASIVVQLLRVVIPRFEALHNEGRPARPSSPSTPVT